MLHGTYNVKLPNYCPVIYQNTVFPDTWVSGSSQEIKENLHIHKTELENLFLQNFYMKCFQRRTGMV